MGKKRVRQQEDTAEPEGPRKRHKKNRHHKKYKSVLLSEEGGGEGVSVAVESSPGSRPLTLKIKLGSKRASSTAASDSHLPDDASSLAESDSLLGGGGSSSVAETDSLPTSGSLGAEWEGESDVSVGEDERVVLSNGEEEDEEEAWLEALESGDVNERGYLPQKREGSTLTARQRAMMGTGDAELLQLPLGKADKEMTEEMILKKTEKNRKRRLAAQKRKERKKADTVRRLIEKQTNKKKDDEKANLISKPSLPHIRYVQSSLNGASLSFPPGVTFPITSQKATNPPTPQLCAVDGCRNAKRYSDSTTKLPLCSLECYKRLRSASSHANSVAIINSEIPT